MAKSKDPGLGSKFSSNVKRLINEDGSYNIVRKGGMNAFSDFYKFLIDLTWFKFFLLSAAAYIGINLIFALLYLLVGIDQMNGHDPAKSAFLDAFYFSVQTFTTVGYGHLSPSGPGIGIISTFEAFIGLMFFALITGLLYGRFSKPSSKIRFAKNVIITRHNGEDALMFKMVNQRSSVLLNASVKCILAMTKGSGHHSYNKEYHPIELETDRVNFFPLTWTLVHIIDEKSPLYQLSIRDLKKKNAELIVLVEAFDETFSQNIIEKASFADDQWIDKVAFVKNFSANSNGEIELHVDKIDEVIRL